MPNTRLCEAVWTLDEGPIERKSQAAALFGAVGEVVSVEPARYDLNRRGQWRRYGGRRLMVDVLTQRTQLVTIAEDRSVDEGGAEVVVTTGKHGELPQAIARWRQSWPPGRTLVEQWIRAVDGAFDDLALQSFVLRVGDDSESDPSDDAVCLAATGDRGRYGDVEAMVEGGRPFGTGSVRGWHSIPLDGD